MDRRNEVINEALAEEVRRGEQRKKMSDGTTAAPEPVAGSAALELREDPIEPDPNPKRRMLMKSASSTASGSGQRKEKRSIPDDESRMQRKESAHSKHSRRNSDQGGREQWCVHNGHVDLPR